MAGIKVTITGFVAPLGKSADDQPFPAVITGTLGYSGLEIGGGPVIPPGKPGEPGVPAHPIFWPPGSQIPSHPIYIPGHPEHPIGIGPEHPIVLPPVDVPPPDGGTGDTGWQLQIYWTAENGWGVAFVPKEGTLVPTPSKK